MAEASLRRHDLVRPTRDGWAHLLADCRRPADATWLTTWAQRDWPLVVRRRSDGDPPCDVGLGLPLPPSHGKRRIAVSLPRTKLGWTGAPPDLHEAASGAPAPWHATIQQLCALGAHVTVFGALAWQWLTQQPYLTPTSDLDLIWLAPCPVHVPRLLEEITAIELRAPMRLDGELVRADGAAVHWRELASGAPDVLVKRLDGGALETRRVFLEGLA